VSTYDHTSVYQGELDFAFYAPTELCPLNKADLQKAIAKAKDRNPPGVFAILSKSDSDQQLAGYLGFKTGGMFKMWVETKLPLVLGQWVESRRHGFGCDLKTFDNHDWNTKTMFDILQEMTEKEVEFITGDDFPVTSEQLGVTKQSDKPGYYSWLWSIHRLITSYSDHFPDDKPQNSTPLHTPENWYRGILVLRAYWLKAKTPQARDRKRGYAASVAYKPRMLGDVDVEEIELDPTAEYALARQQHYLRQKRDAEATNLDEEHGLDLESDESGIARQNKAVSAITDFQKMLNPTGDVTSEAKKRASTARLNFTPEQLRRWIADMNADLFKSMTSTKEVEGSFAKDANNTVFNKVVHFADEEESLRTGSGFFKRTTDEEAQAEFKAISEQVSSNSSEPISFEDACRRHNLDPRDIQVPGITLQPYPHQILGK
jgi:hypothetical protein